MKDVVIVSACRTAIGKYGGAFKDVPAVDLGAVVIEEAIKRAGIAKDAVDEVVMGNVLQSGLGQNPARQAMIKAGMPVGKHVSGTLPRTKSSLGLSYGRRQAR